MKLADLYTEYFANWVSEGSLVNRDKISLIGIRALYDRYLTASKITKMWVVTAVPVHFDVNLMHAIRDVMFRAYPDVDTIIHTYSIPANVNVTSDMYKRHLHAASKNYHMYKSVFDQLSEDEQLTGLTDIDSESGRKIRVDRDTLNYIRDDYDSYSYVYAASVEGQIFSNTYFFIQASCSSRRLMAKYKKRLTDLMNENGVSLSEIHGNVGQYLSNFCPATMYQDASQIYRTMLLSEENLAVVIPNKINGLVAPKGVMIALDWQSKLPFFIDFFNTGSAQIIALIARSGAGKTFLAFTIATMLSGHGVHWSAIDIKGGEWSKLQKFVDVQEISMSGNSAKFVNTMRLDDIQCTEEDCAEFFDSAIQGTCDMFEIGTALSPSEGNVADLRALLNEAVTKLFASKGIVRSNPKTFKDTKDFKYSDVLSIISSLQMANSYTADQKKICKLIQTRTSPYFLGEGRYVAAFKNELTVGAIMESPGVVYNFNKNQDEQLDTLDSMRVYMSQFLDGKKHSIRRRDGLHTAAFYEELQRSLQIGKLVDSISQKVTGSRSNNLTVFLLLNAVSTFQAQEFAAVRSNITTKIIGKTTSEDERLLVEQFDCKMIADYIHTINTNVTGEYANCFAIQYDTGLDQNKAIIKSVVPKTMIDAFKTRTFESDVV